MTVRRKGGQLLLQLRGVALRALGFLLAEDDGFKLVAALSAKVFKNWHDRSQTTINIAAPTLAYNEGRRWNAANYIIDAATRTHAIQRPFRAPGDVRRLAPLTCDRDHGRARLLR